VTERALTYFSVFSSKLGKVATSGFLSKMLYFCKKDDYDYN